MRRDSPTAIRPELFPCQAQEAKMNLESARMTLFSETQAASGVPALPIHNRRGRKRVTMQTGNEPGWGSSTLDRHRT